ncbi:hypothetical protein V8F20_001164 [Naviculisporaceae sp. PSN 640]
MMNCSCRTTALRLFVRNVTSIQVPADFAARQVARNKQSLHSITSSLLAGLDGRTTTGAFRNLQQSRALHITPARHNTEETAATNASPSGSNDGEGPVLNARKLRKIRRMEEKKRLKEAEAQAKAEAKAKVKAEYKAKAKTRTARRKEKSTTRKKKEAENGTDVTETTTEAPAATEPVRLNGEDQPEKKMRKKKEKKKAEADQPKEESSAESQTEKKGKEEKPWEVERKKKEEEKKRQEEKERKKNLEPWKIQKAALKEKFPEGWKPKKKMSPDAMAGIRALHRQFPDTYTTDVLAQKFEMSPEAIRRILKSKWEETDETPDIDIKRQERWFNRGKAIWARYAAMGKKPPRKWRAEGVVRHPSWNIPRGQASKRGGSVWALRKAIESKPEKEEDPETAEARKSWLSKRQHRRNLMAKERKLLRQASDGLLNSFF